jgi:rRNA maturation RNase YbeY
MHVSNAQQEVPVDVARMARVARLASRQLPIRTRGRFEITFINAPSMRRLNKQFLHHDRDTDVLSFRYDGESTVGEILIAPSQAHRYAARHGLSYPEELARYVIHGLLHWLGHDDRTPSQQKRMRAMEDELLSSCITRTHGRA